MKNLKQLKMSLVLLVSAGLWLSTSVVFANDTESGSGLRLDSDELDIRLADIASGSGGAIEEVVVTARSLSGAQELVMERMDDEVVIDVLSAEAISRMGDSTVAAALRRIPGLSLVNDKYVYIRGLGERYSASALNGARIPSPDLTRNVIPLDIFPTSIVESLRVQKAYSADMPANFGGGSVDIRTKGIPDDFTVSFELSSSFNTENDRDGLTYKGGGDDDLGEDDGTRALSAALLSEINALQGNVDIQSILSSLGSGTSLADAQLANRQLGLMLRRDIGVQDKDIGTDYGLKGSIGNNFILGDMLEAGFLVGASYDNQWRNSKAISRNFSFPQQRIDTENETTRTVDISANANFGLRYGNDHELSTTSLFIRNTDDEAAISDFFNENREIADGEGFRSYRLTFEQREVEANQIKGVHRLGAETRDILPDVVSSLLDQVKIPEETEFSWFYSDADAQTDIPNQVNVSANTVNDPLTGEVLSSSVALDSSAADYRFTELDDKVKNYGWSINIPFSLTNSTLDVAFGYEHDQKGRNYQQSTFALGALSVADPSILSGPLDTVFSDQNITNPANNFVFDLAGTNNQSYVAATMTDAYFTKFDWLYQDKWRVSAGARFEDYRQVALDYNPFGFTATNPVMTTDPDVLAAAAYKDDKVYPALALTYISDWMAETFQLRFGWSETTVRPDLREITDASYIDPITDDLVDGNPGVIPADVSNFDVRAEWFFSNGDNLTATFFYKDISNPIEFFESAASDTNTAREIVNAESAEVYGVEFEGLHALGFWDDQFFIKGSLTLQDSELVAGSAADAPTNDVRAIAGASQYVANMALGFDSSNGRHSASLGYNVFGERLYVAGRNGAPDGFEQPFHSMDFTYSWFPTDNLTLKAKFKNILDESVTIERVGVTTFEEEVGSTYAISLQWAM